MTQKLFVLLCVWVGLSLTSCRSKRQLAAPSLAGIGFDSLRHSSDTIGLPSYLIPLLVPAHDSLAPLLSHASKQKPYRRRPVSKLPIEVQPPIELPKPGTRILRRTVDVSSVYKEIERVVVYDITHQDVPASFDGYRMAFVTDTHYKSRFTERGLGELTRLLIAQKPDVVLMGGDYHEGCQYVIPLMQAISHVKTPHGACAVLGNNDYQACYEDIVAAMEHYQIRLLEHKVDTLYRGKDRIMVTGVRNPFNLAANGKSPTLELHPDDFVVLLTHTPDYVEDVSIANTGVALAGHTHGGQVTLFGLYAPVVPSRYGQRFLKGLKYNSHRTPVIISNGIGTSKQNVRLFAPPEIVMVVLHPLR